MAEFKTAVFVQKVEMGTDKSGGTYQKITDQEHRAWFLFKQFAQKTFVPNTAYLFAYVQKDNGFTDVVSIEPINNHFVVQALKEVSNKNDIWRNFSVCFSYAKDLAIADKIPAADIFIEADKIYEYFTVKADEEFNKIGNPDAKNPT